MIWYNRCWTNGSGKGEFIKYVEEHLPYPVLVLKQITEVDNIVMHLKACYPPPGALILDVPMDYDTTSVKFANAIEGEIFFITNTLIWITVPRPSLRSRSP